MAHCWATLVPHWPVRSATKRAQVGRKRSVASVSRSMAFRRASGRASRPGVSVSWCLAPAA